MLYKGECLNQISFPLGGIGTGSIGLAGNGSLVDFEIFNLPNKGAINPYTFFAIRAEYSDGTCVSKVLQGDHTRDLAGQYLGTAWGDFIRIGDVDTVLVHGGSVVLSSLSVGRSDKLVHLSIDGKVIPHTQIRDQIRFEATEITNRIEVRFV